MSFAGPPPPDRPVGGGGWGKKSDIDKSQKPKTDPTVPRSTPLKDAPRAEPQYGRDDYARRSCISGSCTYHDDSASASGGYTHDKK